MQALIHEREGFVLDAGVADYMQQLNICKHYNIGWPDRERLSADDVLKAQLYFQANGETYAAAHPATE